MKKLLLALALLCTASTAPHLLSARPVASSHQAPDNDYEEGMADGDVTASSYEASYGCGSSQYNAAINAEANRAAYNAWHSDAPVYWRGYRTGLLQHCN